MITDEVGVVVIGRNEGERLKLCLQSIPSGFPVAYVDSGSTDGSVSFAHSLGVNVVELDMTLGFTAARARNAGWRQLTMQFSALKFIQFVDGDCELQGDWIGKAYAAMQPEPTLAAVFGRRRERHPEKSIYNRMCDDEWNVPVGKIQSCGGDVLLRRSALEAANGYSDDLIAGEEPDLCLRLAHKGWFILRIDAEMTLHDADILEFRSWWNRSKRSGFAYAQHVCRHGEKSFRSWIRQLISISTWGLLFPALAFFTLLYSVVSDSDALIFLYIIFSLYFVQTFRIAIKKIRFGMETKFATHYAIQIMIGKFSCLSGVIQYFANKVFRRSDTIIEYKNK